MKQESSSFADQFLERLDNRTAVIGIIGLGYVGLPLSFTFHNAGFKVIGFDVDPVKIKKLAVGELYIQHLGEEAFRTLADSDRFSATDDFDQLSEVDAILICVPTPIGKHNEPDLSYVLNSGLEIAKRLRPGQLIVLESTTYPGTTDEELFKVLDQKGLDLGEDYFLAFSPEREDPGNPNFTTHNIPKVVGGVDKISGELAAATYRFAIDEVVHVSSARVAEASKLMENIYRAVNIALVNELKMVFQKLDIDIWEVLDAASTKPFGFNRFNPGPGWGGHCIPIDPFYLTWKAKAVGMTSHFIERAGEINTRMPEYVLERLQNALNEKGLAMKGVQVLLLGVAYKSDIDDVRESPAFPFMDLLHQRGSEISYHDPYIPSIPATRKWPHLKGMTSSPLDQETLSKVDAVVILTHHKKVDLAPLKNFTGVIVDTRNALDPEDHETLIKA